MNKVLKREKWVSRWHKKVTKILLEPTLEEQSTIKEWLYDLYDGGTRYLYPFISLPSDVQRVFDSHNYDNLQLEIRALCRKYGTDNVTNCFMKEKNRIKENKNDRTRG